MDDFESTYIERDMPQNNFMGVTKSNHTKGNVLMINDLFFVSRNEKKEECLLKALLRGDCLMDITLMKSLLGEKTMMENLGHMDPNDVFKLPWKESCKAIVKREYLCEEQQFIVAFEISYCIVIFCLKICVKVCEVVVWKNHLHNIIQCKYSIRVSPKIWFQNHNEIVEK